MRAIDKGDWPINEKTQKQVKFHSDKVKPSDDTNYRKANRYLTERLGKYCSFCEMQLETGLHVEHKLPKDSKSAYPELRGDWNNFVLACTHCNSSKNTMKTKWQLKEGEKPPDPHIVLDAYYWPDQDNTTCLFEYERGGLISINQYLTDDQLEKAEKTFKLTDIGKQTVNKNNENPRLEARFKAYTGAKRSLEKLQQSIQRSKEYKNDKLIEETYEDIAIQALDKGFFSVWMTVFQDYPDMQERLIKAFPGTSFVYIRCEENPESFKNLVAKFDSELADRLVKVWGGKAWMVVSREDEKKLKIFQDFQQIVNNSEICHLITIVDKIAWFSISYKDEKILNIIEDIKQLISAINPDLISRLVKVENKKAFMSISWENMKFMFYQKDKLVHFNKIKNLTNGIFSI